jgi:molybdenum storage protein
MPTGVIARFGSMISDQNALMIATLLSPWGGIKISHSDIVKLPTYFAEGIIPVMHGMPPYDYFAIKPEKGRIPIHRTDVGLVILGGLIGARRILFVKDEDGLYTEDPKKNPDAQFIPDITVAELMEKDQDDLVIERSCLEIIKNSEVIEQVQVINGMKEGNITKALAGEHVGPSSANRTANRTGDYPADDLFGEVKGFERVNSNLATYF